MVQLYPEPPHTPRKAHELACSFTVGRKRNEQRGDLNLTQLLFEDCLEQSFGLVSFQVSPVVELSHRINVERLRCHIRQLRFAG
jgi:hypothetical protein